MAETESDHDWYRRMHEEIDAELGAVRYFAIRAKHRGTRWRPVARVQRASSAEAQIAAIERELATIPEHIIEVQAWARGRTPISVRMLASPPGESSLGDDDLDDPPSPLTAKAGETAIATLILQQAHAERGRGLATHPGALARGGSTPP
jgi:hypothetical protein